MLDPVHLEAQIFLMLRFRDYTTYVSTTPHLHLNAELVLLKPSTDVVKKVCVSELVNNLVNAEGNDEVSTTYLVGLIRQYFINLPPLNRSYTSTKEK